MSNRRTAPTGILGFPIAPFNNDGKLDELALAQNVEFLVKEGLSAIFVSAGAGEFQSLSKNEYETMAEIAVSVTNGRIPVYTGVGGNIAHAVECAQISEKKGADGILILPPYLINGEQEGLFLYYKTILESSDLNAILYQRDNAILTVSTAQRLIEFPQLVGIKDGYGSMELNMEMVQTIGDQLSWMNGMPFAEITYPAYKPLGFETYTSAISNYIPHISRMFLNAVKENNQILLSELYQHALFPINRIRKQRKGYAVSLIKAGMEIMGLSVGQTVRPPLVEVEKEHYLQLEAVLKRALDRFPN